MSLIQLTINLSIFKSHLIKFTLLPAMIPTLTKNAIEIMVSNQKIERGNLIVQTIMPVKDPRGHIKLSASDGLYSNKAVVYLKGFQADSLINAIILVEECSYSKTLGIILNKFSILGYYFGKVGQPIEYGKKDQNGIKQCAPPLESTRFMPYINEKEKIEKVVHSGKKTLSDQVIRLELSDQNNEQNIDENDLKQCNTIRDLFASFQNWELLVRVIKKEFKQFTNKNNKQTKVVNMILMDHTRAKIGGVIFGDAAVRLNEQLVQNRIYRISKGQVSEDDYNKGANGLSKYKILFNERSVFAPILETNLIPRVQENYITLGEAYQKKEIDLEQDIVAVLQSIGDIVDLSKQGRPLKKRNLQICDPQKEIKMDVIIWNEKQPLSSSFVNKTILLSSFKLHEYRQVLSLASTFRSSIKLVSNHRFNTFEGKVRDQTYQLISQKKKAKIDATIFDLVSLKSEVSHMDDNSPAIYSQLNVVVNEIHIHKKFFYEACPNLKCKKSAQPNSRCPSCETEIDQTVPHFIMGIQLMDHSGGIQTIAYDDFAHKILFDRDFSKCSLQEHTKFVREISSMNNDQRRKFISKSLFKEYNVIISSFMDKGLIKHKIQRVFESPFQVAACKNIKKIVKYLSGSQIIIEQIK